MQYLVVSLFLLQGIFASAQTSDAAKEPKKLNNTFYICPGCFFDVVNPALQIRYERILSPKISLHLDAGIIILHSVPGYIALGYGNAKQSQAYKDTVAPGIDINTYSGYKLKAEGRYWLLDPQKSRGIAPFLSAGIFYIQNNYTKRSTLRCQTHPSNTVRMLIFTEKIRSITHTVRTLKLTERTTGWT